MRLHFVLGSPRWPFQRPSHVIDLPHGISTKCGSNTFGYTGVYDAVAWGFKLREKASEAARSPINFPTGAFRTHIPTQISTLATNIRRQLPGVPYGLQGPVQWGHVRQPKLGAGLGCLLPGAWRDGSDGHPLGYYTHTGAAAQGQFSNVRKEVAVWKENMSRTEPATAWVVIGSSMVNGLWDHLCKATRPVHLSKNTSFVLARTGDVHHVAPSKQLSKALIILSATSN